MEDQNNVMCLIQPVPETIFMTATNSEMHVYFKSLK